MSKWGKTKYIDGVSFIPYFNEDSLTKDSYIYDVYISDSRGKGDEETKKILNSVKGDWIGKQYKDWI